MTMRAGTLGFFGESEDLGELARAIRLVANGHSFISAELSHRITWGTTTDSRGAEPRTAGGDDSPSSDSGSAVDFLLSPREHEVLRFFLAGMSVSEIASKFFRSPKTISAQKQSAYRKLGIRNDAELFAVRNLIEKN